MLGRQSQPGTEMFFIRKLAHIRSHFHDHRLGQRYSKPIHHAQIHSTDALQVFAYPFRIMRLRSCCVNSACAPKAA